VTTDAKPGTPIAVTNWQHGTQTRVYYLDTDNKTRQRVRMNMNPGDNESWKDSSDFPREIASQQSRLAAARSDENDSNILVYYQDMNGHIQELKYDSDDHQWYLSKMPIVNATIGTDLAVISGLEQVRLYYLSSQDAKLREMYYDGERWYEKSIDQYNMAPGAPLSAVAWNYGGKFRIRVYTVNGSNQLVQLVFNKEKGGWKAVVTTDEIVLKHASRGSAVAAVLGPYTSAIQVFYQPESNVIGQARFLCDAVKNERVPLGIPTSF
jgi:hypothetical protein